MELEINKKRSGKSNNTNAYFYLIIYEIFYYRIYGFFMKYVLYIESWKFNVIFNKFLMTFQAYLIFSTVLTLTNTDMRES